MTRAATTTGRPAVLGDWRDGAACRAGSVDPEIFFPVAVDGPDLEAQAVLARAVCAGCPVRAQCLAWAMESLPYGIAGGLTEVERSRLRATDPARRITRAMSVAEVVAVAPSRVEIAAAGRAALRAGCGVPTVARRYGVTVRTAARWARRVRAETCDTETVETALGEGSRGGSRAPLGSPDSANPLAGTRTVEGHRS